MNHITPGRTMLLHRVTKTANKKIKPVPRNQWMKRDETGLDFKNITRLVTEAPSKSGKVDRSRTAPQKSGKTKSSMAINMVSFKITKYSRSASCAASPKSV